jgi:hypothetical protein
LETHSVTWLVFCGLLYVKKYFLQQKGEVPTQVTTKRTPAMQEWGDHSVHFSKSMSACVVRSYLYWHTKNFNIGPNFWMVGTRTLIFQSSALLITKPSMGITIFDLVIPTFMYDYFLQTISLPLTLAIFL